VVSTTFRTITSEDWQRSLRLSRKRREQQQRMIRTAIERRLREIGSVTFSRPTKAASNDDNQ
jgi:spore germination cell wall hydrolase CwlJ-like protein